MMPVLSGQLQFTRDGLRLVIDERGAPALVATSIRPRLARSDAQAIAVPLQPRGAATRRMVARRMHA